MVQAVLIGSEAAAHGRNILNGSFYLFDGFLGSCLCREINGGNPHQFCGYLGNPGGKLLALVGTDLHIQRPEARYLNIDRRGSRGLRITVLHLKLNLRPLVPLYGNDIAVPLNRCVGSSRVIYIIFQHTGNGNLTHSVNFAVIIKGYVQGRNGIIPALHLVAVISHLHIQIIRIGV